VSVAGVQTDGANFYNYAVVSNDGILFEDDAIQIGYQIGTQRELGRLVLYYGNFSNEKMNLTTALSAESKRHSSSLLLLLFFFLLLSLCKQSFISSYK